MPFIEVKTNKTTTKAEETLLKEKLGKAIESIPGKSERWLMVNLIDSCKLYFQGDGELPAAYVEVKILGSVDRAAYERMTGAVCEILSSVLEIAPDRVYVKYEACADWGWNGSNF